MLLSIKRLDGKAVEIDSATIFRLRPALKSLEAPGAVSVLHYDRSPFDQRYETLASKLTMTAVAKILEEALPMVKLTSPVGTPVYLDAAKIVEVQPSNKEMHFPKAKAVAHLFGQTQQLLETVAEAKSKITAARERFKAIG